MRGHGAAAPPRRRADDTADLIGKPSIVDTPDVHASSSSAYEEHDHGPTAQTSQRHPPPDDEPLHDIDEKSKRRRRPGDFQGNQTWSWLCFWSSRPVHRQEEATPPEMRPTPAWSAAARRRARRDDPKRCARCVGSTRSRGPRPQERRREPRLVGHAPRSPLVPGWVSHPLGAHRKITPSSAGAHRFRQSRRRARHARARPRCWTS